MGEKLDQQITGCFQSMKRRATLPSNSLLNIMLLMLLFSSSQTGDPSVPSKQPRKVVRTSPWPRRIHLSSHTLTAQHPEGHGRGWKNYRFKDNSWWSKMLVAGVRTNSFHWLSWQITSEFSACSLLSVDIPWNFPRVIPPPSVWGRSSWTLAADWQKLSWLPLLSLAGGWRIVGCSGIPGDGSSTLWVHDPKEQQEGLDSQKPMGKKERN